jgi:CBS domain-containing protein
MALMFNLVKVRRWIHAAFRTSGPRARVAPLEASEGWTDDAHLRDFTRTWHDQAASDQWSRLTCAKVMHSPIIILPDAPVAEALELLECNSMLGLPAVNAEQRLIGLITREQLTAACEQRPATSSTDVQRVSPMMVTGVVAVRKDTSLGSAFLILMGDQSPCLPVVEWRGHVVGMLGEADILEIASTFATAKCPTSPPSARGWSMPGFALFSRRDNSKRSVSPLRFGKKREADQLRAQRGLVVPRTRPLEREKIQALSPCVLRGGAGFGCLHIGRIVRIAEMRLERQRSCKSGRGLQSVW